MRKLIGACLSLLMLTAPIFPSVPLAGSFSLHSFFDDYAADLPWSEQRWRLDNFGSALVREPEHIGYVGFYSSAKVSRKKVEATVRRSVRHLTGFRKVDAARVVVMYLGEYRYAKIILQPTMRGVKPPFEMPTDQNSAAGDKPVETSSR